MTRKRAWGLSALLLTVLLGLFGGCGQSAAPPSRLILITIDTLRADYLGVYGYPDLVSPRLDDLAARSLVVHDVSSTAPITGPSHASILTSRAPSAHGMIYNGHRAPAGSPGAQGPTLAAHLAAQGFRTGAVVSAGPVSAEYGFDRGFDYFHQVKRDGDLEAGGAAAAVGEAGLAWLEASGDSPTFLWLHYFEPHLPYVTPPEIRAELGIEDDLPVTTDNVGSLRRHTIRQAYRAEVFETDLHVGRLLDALAAAGLMDNTLLVVTSDHGEYLGEHGLTGHNRLYEEVLHVPLIIHAPDMVSRRDQDGPASTLDIAPTVLDWLGLPPLPQARGRSLRKGPGDPDRPVFAEAREFRLLDPTHSPEPGDFLVSARVGLTKYIQDVLVSGRDELFHLGDDPAEARNLASAKPSEAQHMKATLTDHIRDDLPDGLAGTRDIHLDARALEMLKSLGYVR